MEKVSAAAVGLLRVVVANRFIADAVEYPLVELQVQGVDEAIFATPSVQVEPGMSKGPSIYRTAVSNASSTTELQ